MESIRVVGARTHNLKNLTVEIPKNKITVVTGLSGSGKSSLAFDTIFAEGQRRYIESLSSFVRQFLSEIEKPDFDYIEGLAPAIAIDQKTAARNPRSTVATATEIYDFLRLLFSRVGTPFCPKCDIPITQQSPESIARAILKHFRLEETLKVTLYALIVQARKGEHKFHLKQGKKSGILRVRVDGVEMDINEAIGLEVDKNKRHTIEFLVGSIDFPVSNDQSEQLAQIDLLKLVDRALKLGNGLLIASHGDKEEFYSQKFACTKCGWQFPDIEPRLFSFNNPEGACQICQGLGVQMVADRDLVIPNPRLTLAEGAVRPWSRTTSHANWYQKVLNDLSAKYRFSLDTPVGELPEATLDILLHGEKTTNDSDEEAFEGILPNLERRYRETDSDYLKNEIEKYMVEKTCQSCNGQRLRVEVLSVRIKDKNIIDATSMSIEDANNFFAELSASVHASQQVIAVPILKEIRSRLSYLLEVGLSYVTLDRTTSTLAGGEAQRVRLATQLGAGLTGVIYILDEPSIGLHPRDHDKLLQTIEELKERGNTVIVVEHDKETMLRADEIIDMGPGAGEHGGKIISQGTLKEILNDPNSVTGAYLSGKKSISLPEHRHEHAESYLTVVGATGNNLKNVTASFPLNRLICVTGVSGSGKSTLVEDTLARALENQFHGSGDDPAPHERIEGTEEIDNIINIDQSPIGRTPRSNPATYTGALGPIRELFANTSEAMNRGYDPSRFSFNLRGGRCEHCRGDGQIKIEMNFLPDVYVQCPECRSRRYNAETLEIKYKGKDISDVLEMSVEEALNFFDGEIEVTEKLSVLQSVGLEYMRLGQPATTLSGGEAQRIKLATELAKRETGKTLYILDEPTTGLHFEDIQKLLTVLYQLVDRGNTVIIIEHNTDVIRCADWIVDLGPDGGTKGGNIVATGTPDEIIKNPQSITGKFLVSSKADAPKKAKTKTAQPVHT
ncbi:MAG: excinuclease ABC subunit UvrA [Candidatus Berkelbacteria bacterium]|nr:MAG: excinuclease ABC subunit UvrA [Candidatus Berkelbacteria bacterium]QQG51997.1 MAG: excinuclease ABC subunit UvrA [Candidatus Berkelbacteria bacterium]